MRHAADAIDSPAMRQAGRELLSLALMDARNHTLHLLACYEPVRPDAVLSVADAIAQHAARWTAPQAADAAFPSRSLAEARERLLVQFEATLEALDAAPDDDAGLAAFRAALFHEDAWGEELVVEAQALGLALPLAVPAAIAPREPVALPATRWTLGSPVPGFAFALERPAHAVDVPEFEIDAQPVTWSQYIEFVDDGGYDREALWSAEGWAWLQRVALGESRRGPRHVEQIGVASGAVTQALFGRVVRLSGAQPAMHVAWWEADAYARWAGRRLPTEVEWEVAAHQAARRGFRWGDVREWTAGTLRPWPGYGADAWARGTPFDPEGAWGRARVLRGASFATRSRMKHPKARGFALPERDAAFTGFRTCAV
ncbi:SUMF1/EgtB/PvdO family nonheme iron enzyme [Ramlibacter sp. MAHUQ-53]|uniref:SUMF1/EgtB/PvdO family nonheme iron enzyme n=1 Tax=unclassified Ramlibacter TaxID=2617605 RepID=UPI0036292A1B